MYLEETREREVEWMVGGGVGEEKGEGMRVEKGKRNGGRRG